jgi:hypothetical protein
MVIHMKVTETPACTHCGATMKKWEIPPGTTWDAGFHYVCFNDDCPYFVNGWDWMQQQYKAHASYRHCIDPETGCSRPLPVWSDAALKDRIISDN